MNHCYGSSSPEDHTFTWGDGGAITCGSGRETSSLYHGSGLGDKTGGG